MSIDVRITSNDKVARIVNGGSLSVIDEQIPSFGQELKAVYYRDYFRDAAGSEDMMVDGSRAPVEFTINAPDEGADRWINVLSFALIDGGATLTNFLNKPPLTNGVEIEYTSNIVKGNVVNLAGIPLQRNSDIIRLCNGTPAFGNGANAFRATNLRGTQEGYLPVLFINQAGLPGIRLRSGTQDKIIVRINDDINRGNSDEEFTVIATGFDRLEI